MWEVVPFGYDCLGNCTGWRVQRYTWQPNPFSQRADGLELVCLIAEQFVGDIYNPEQRRVARAAAEVLAAQLNASEATIH